MQGANDVFTQATAAAESVRDHTSLVPRVGIILGSGLGDFAASVDSAATIPYQEIPFFPRPSVEGHSGNLVLGSVHGVPVAVMQGRVHAYEGYTLAEVVFPVRVLGLLGVRTLIVTNAAGGIDPGYAPGTLVAIRDHLNMTGANAATGPNEPRFAVVAGAAQRFFDMSFAYSPVLRQLAQEEAAKAGFALPEGVYLAVAGPSYETPAEIRAFRTLGADLVGMSTVHEVIAARHMGLEVLGLSLVTNPAAGVTSEAIDHAEVMLAGKHAAARFRTLLEAILARL